MPYFETVECGVVTTHVKLSFMLRFSSSVGNVRHRLSLQEGMVSTLCGILVACPMACAQRGVFFHVDGCVFLQFAHKSQAWLRAPLCPLFPPPFMPVRGVLQGAGCLVVCAMVLVSLSTCAGDHMVLSGANGLIGASVLQMAKSRGIHAVGIVNRFVALLRGLKGLNPDVLQHFRDHTGPTKRR